MGMVDAALQADTDALLKAAKATKLVSQTHVEIGLLMRWDLTRGLTATAAAVVAAAEAAEAAATYAYRCTPFSVSLAELF
jgi:homoserine kinase